MLIAPIPAAAPAQADSSPALSAKSWKFAVVSIRKNNTGGPQNFGVATPDGYQMKNMFLAAAIFTAYVPTTPGVTIYSDDQIVGLPDWAFGDNNRYDLDAKVDDADLADWQNPAKQPAMLKTMLQAMLADRLQLVAHRSTKEGAIYSLTVGKNGPRFKPTNPAEPHPGAYSFPGGGLLAMEMKGSEIATHYFGITIGQLTTYLLGSAGRPIHDDSGLSGKYDITILKQAPASPEGAQQAAPAEDSEPSAVSIAEQLGLKLQPARGAIESLVIDHINRPSEN